MYLDTLLIGHKHFYMLIILNAFSTLPKELQNFVTNNVFGQKVRTTSTTKHRNPCQSQESNMRALAPEAGALPRENRVN